MKLKFLTSFLLTASVVLFLSSMKLDPNNPPTGRTGAPGETTCQASGCHSGGNYTGTVSIEGVPDTIVAEQSYSVTLTNTSNAIKSGFQLTVLNEANQKTGILTAGTGCSIGNAGNRQYVRQSTPHTLANGSTSWTFTWKAPLTVVGDSIHFYFTSLCANGNGNDNGDNVLVGRKSVVQPQPVSAANEVEAKDPFTLYPNPAKSNLKLTFLGEGNLKIFSADGQTVVNSKIAHTKNLDVSKLTSGIYFAKIEADGKTFSRHFIKE